MSKTSSKVYMAFASGSETTEGAAMRRYIGVASVGVLAVNPSKAELEKLYGTTLDKEPEYLGVGKVGEEEKPQIRLDFIVHTDPEKNNGIDMTSKISFFLKKEYRFNKNKTKVQVIDKYGECAWPTIEEAKNKTIPQYASGPANIDADYRPAYIGEEELTGFLKAYLNVPARQYKNSKTGEIITIENPADAEARLDRVASYFDGDISELKSVVTLQPNNRVKVVFGVKTAENNKMYQDVYTQRILKNYTSDFSKIDAEIKDRQSNGGYSHTTFSVEPLKEFSLTPTEFAKEDATATSAPATDEWFKA
jgi:hypothetical protein